MPTSTDYNQAAYRTIRNNLLAFTRYTYPTYQPAAHLVLLCDALERVERGEIKRLLVTLPPRHGKSEATSIRFPAWYLGRNPDKRVIVASYASDLAQKFSRQVRALVQDERYQRIFPGIALSKDSRSVEAWDIAGRGGGYKAVGVGGALTGFGGNLIAIDDPLRNRADAESETIRQGIWDWYTSTAYTRLEKDGCLVVTQTRWHEEDLAGRLLAEMGKGGDQWHILHMPALSDDDTPLWPWKYDLAALRGIRATIGSRDWYSLYQGQPLPAGGSMLKQSWFRIVRPDQVPPLVEKLVGVDLAISAKTTADYTVIQPLGVDAQGNIYLYRSTRHQAEWPDSRKAIISAVLAFQPARIGIEKVAFQAAAAQDLRREPLLAGFPLLDVPADRDKVTRALGWSPIAEQGRIFLVEDGDVAAGTAWTPAFLREASAFPVGKKDDQIDAVGIAFALLRVRPNTIERPGAGVSAAQSAPPSPKPFRRA